MLPKVDYLCLRACVCVCVGGGGGGGGGGACGGVCWGVWGGGVQNTNASHAQHNICTNHLFIFKSRSHVKVL